MLNYLSDESFWQPYYQEFQIVDLNAGQPSGAGSPSYNYTYKGIQIPQSIINGYEIANIGSQIYDLHKSELGSDVNNWAKYPQYIREILSKQTEYLDTISPWKEIIIQQQQAQQQLQAQQQQLQLAQQQLQIQQQLNTNLVNLKYELDNEYSNTKLTLLNQENETIKEVNNFKSTEISIISDLKNELNISNQNISENKDNIQIQNFNEYINSTLNTYLNNYESNIQSSNTTLSTRLDELTAIIKKEKIAAEDEYKSNYQYPSYADNVKNLKEQYRNNLYNLYVSSYTKINSYELQVLTDLISLVKQQLSEELIHTNNEIALANVNEDINLSITDGNKMLKYTIATIGGILLYKSIKS